MSWGAQTGARNEAVDSMLATDKKAKVAALDDLNTFQRTNDLAGIFPGTGPDRVPTKLVNRLGESSARSSSKPTARSSITSS